MAIPEINQSQVETLVEMATNGLGAFSAPVPDIKTDNYETYNKMSGEMCDHNQLVILGLIKEITDQCGDKLATMYAMSGRQFRIFEITEIGKAMFSGHEHKA